MATIDLASVGARLSYSNPDRNYYNPSSVDFYSNQLDQMVLRFNPIPDAYKYRAITRAVLRMYGYGSSVTGGSTKWSFQYAWPAESFDPRAVTYNTYDTSAHGWNADEFSNNSWSAQDLDGSFSKVFGNYNYVQIRSRYLSAPNGLAVITGPGGSNKPVIRLTISDTDVTVTPRGIYFTSGFINRAVDNKFMWYLAYDGAITGTFSEQSSVFRWREAGATSWNEIVGTAAGVILPADTLPNGTNIEWQVSVVDNLGRTSTSPTYTITTIDAETTATPTYPINGAAVDETAPITVRWTTSNPNGTDQTKAEISWTVVGSGTWSPFVTVEGNVKEYTYPAGTFPAANIQWDVRAYNTNDVAGPWGSATFTTIDTPAVATPVAPVSTVEDGSAPITFAWTISNDSGSTPTGSDLQVSNDGTTWTDLSHVDGTGTTYTAQANAFTAGVQFWRVRAYNRNGTAGAWSSAVTFVVVAAPLAPSVNVTPVPFATVNWQVEGQQAYRITVDGTIYGPYFGAAKSWTMPDYLRDGEHTILVEVQGVYGLWSQPGSATFSVRNQAGTPITLEGEFDRDAALSWVAGDETADFLIYRDGVQIGHATGLSFTDRLALGPHTYRVINRLPDGNYSISNTVEGTMLSCTAAIAPLDGGDWIELRLSENSDREESFTWSQGVSLRHFAGATYPVAELSPYADESGAYDAAFTDLPSARAFEGLRGQPVILKSRGGNVMIGILVTLSKRMTEFYVAYVFTLQRMHWRDWIDADG